MLKETVSRGEFANAIIGWAGTQEMYHELLGVDPSELDQLLADTSEKFEDLISERITGMTAEQINAFAEKYQLNYAVYDIDVATRIEEFNSQLLIMDVNSDDYGFAHFPQALLLTEQKLDEWKQKASTGAGSMIVGAVDCRYLIIVKEQQPLPGSRVKPTYGFVNIDHAGWTLCDPSFATTDALIEWFAFNTENPVIEVVPAHEVEKSLSRDKVNMQVEGHYLVLAVTPDRSNDWFSVPNLFTLETELLSLQDAGSPMEKVIIVTPEGERMNVIEIQERIIASGESGGGEDVTEASPFKVHYKVLQHQEEIHQGSIKLMLSSTLQAQTVLEEQPLSELSDGKLPDNATDVMLEVLHADAHGES
jgi:hypothetical protein